ncbi:hypothetical protein SDC9_160417 [bioreactor metagenome]|uniref:Uncharacterized protein n=1 Tax=bioreactor metagenome TaxID=1076179 RepID=A0A645FFJ5_9ZZZZ
MHHEHEIAAPFGDAVRQHAAGVPVTDGERVEQGISLRVDNGSSLVADVAAGLLARRKVHARIARHE